jgi:sirohydrochlorin ferrochelatase
LSFLDVEPHVDALAVKAFNEGASRIIVAEVFLTDSNHTLEGEHQVEALNLEEAGVEVRYTRPLWDSDLLARSFLAKLDDKVPREERAKVGILLVGHGQPDEWDVEFPTETEHENKSRERVMNLLAANGYGRENIDLAWMSFKKPTPTEKIDELAKRGVKKVFFFSSAISAEGIHSQVDIPELVEKANAAKGLEIVDLGAWNDHPLVIAAIKERVDEAMNGGGRTRGSGK